MTPNLRDRIITLVAEAMCFLVLVYVCMSVLPSASLVLCLAVSGAAEDGRARRHGLLVGGTIASL